MHPALVVSGLVIGYGAACGVAMYVCAKTNDLLGRTEAKLKAKLEQRKAKLHVIHGKEATK